MTLFTLAQNRAPGPGGILMPILTMIISWPAHFISAARDRQPMGMPGAEHIRDSKVLIEILKRQEKEGRLYGAICASPAVVLQSHGFIKGRKATCHPGFSDMLENKEEINSRVVVDGNCVTSRGPGTAIEFALKLVEILYGIEKAEEVAGPMILPGS